MSSHEENVQKGFLEEWTLDCTDYSKRDLLSILKRLPTVDTKKLILIHVNPVRTCFWGKQPASTQRVFDAIKYNPYIEALELSNDFVKSITKSLNTQRGYINATQLETMRSLKHLILHNLDWDERFFGSLLSFLISDTCQLETLEFRHPLSDEERHQLGCHLEKATSLKICRGSNFLMERPVVSHHDLPDVCLQCN